MRGITDDCECDCDNECDYDYDNDYDSDCDCDCESMTHAGIYIHWPFCERKCPYCDFYTFGREHPNREFGPEYLEALLEEVRTAPERLGWRTRPAADTVYFGGGTPSLMGPAALERIVAGLAEIFDLQAESEITLEVNPTTAETAQLERMLALGVNRLSVGSQSFNDRILAQLGRVHDAATTRRALHRMRELGARNLSLDLIFAAPTQSPDDLRSDLEALLAFAPEHVSAYGMTIHAGTPYARWEKEGRLALPNEDQYAAMYETIVETLARAGFEHYEISNWARPGRASRHNGKYWIDCDVAGFGVSAHGAWGGVRTENPRDLKAYLARDRAAWARPLDPPANDRARRGEVMMLALRRVGGVGWGEIEAWAGEGTRAFYAAELARLAERGLIKDDARIVRLTRRGLLLADTVMADFF